MIREASLKDVPALTDIIVAAWQTAYDGVVDPSFPPTLSKSFFEQLFTGFIAGGRGPFFVYCGREGRIEGSISGILHREGPFDCEVVGLYVHPQNQGRGTGRKLLDHMIAFFREQQCKTMIIWTLKGVRNNGFYETTGGRPLEAKTLSFGGKDYPATGYVYALREP